jgi:hypothetical protein
MRAREEFIDTNIIASTYCGDLSHIKKFILICEENWISMKTKNYIREKETVVS